MTHTCEGCGKFSYTLVGLHMVKCWDCITEEEGKAYYDNWLNVISSRYTKLQLLAPLLFS